MSARREWGKDKAPSGRVIGRGSPGREKIFQIRALYNDVMFLDEFLTPEFVDEQKLYHYRFDPATQKMVVVNRDFEKIKRQLLFLLTNHAQPYIYVMDGNYRNRGELYLAHRHGGADLDVKYAMATLKCLHQAWRRPVHLSARIDDDHLLFTFDGEQSTQQHVDANMEPPANDF
jgi:stage V sporulation protein R